MKLRTSFFNWTILRKDITRFSPLWGLYTAFLLLFMLLVWGIFGGSGELLMITPALLGAGATINLVFGLLAALLLFGDLFQTRLCYAQHALPLRRETLFFTHLAAGFLFCLVPNLLGAALWGLMLGESFLCALIPLLCLVLEYIVFFGIATFSMLCAGSKLGGTTIYGLIIFLAPILSWLCKIFYEPLLYGVTVDVESLSQLSPLWLLSGRGFFDTTFAMNPDRYLFHQMLWEDWLHLGLCAFVGVVFLALALILYRKRPLESAGDFVSFRPIGPVFLVLYSLFLAAVLYYIATLFTAFLGYIFLLAGLVIGFFTGRMLLEKRVAVFRGKNFLGISILTAVLLLTLLATWIDPLGICRYIPDASRVESVRISPYETEYSMQYQSVTLTQEAEILEATQLHKLALDHRQTPEDEKNDSVHFLYTLKNGTVIDRLYMIPEEDPQLETPLSRFYSRPSCVLGGRDAQQVLEFGTCLEYYSYKDSEKDLPYLAIMTPWFNIHNLSYYEDDGASLQHTAQDTLAKDALAVGLMDALLADCQAGTTSQWSRSASPVGTLTIHLTVGGRNDMLYLTVYEDNTNLLDYINSQQGQ